MKSMWNFCFNRIYVAICCILLRRIICEHIFANALFFGVFGLLILRRLDYFYECEYTWTFGDILSIFCICWISVFRIYSSFFVIASGKGFHYIHLQWDFRRISSRFWWIIQIKTIKVMAKTPEADSEIAYFEFDLPHL